MRRPAEPSAASGTSWTTWRGSSLEVDRNVLELTTLLPDPPEIDRRFYADVWQPQEIQHGLVLDEFSRRSSGASGRSPT